MQTARRTMMDQVGEQTVRDDSGRFVAGSSVNPAGKKPGTRSRATVLRALLRDGDEDAIGRVLVDRALGGDPVTARFLIEALNPKPRHRPVALDVPADADAATIFAAARAEMLTGNITPQEMAMTMDAVERGERAGPAVANRGRADAAHRAVDAVPAAR